MQTPYIYMIACMTLIGASSLVNAAQEQLVRCREHHSITECDIKNDRSHNIMERYIQEMLRQHRLCHQLNHHSPLYKLPTALMYNILQYVAVEKKWHLQATISCKDQLRHAGFVQRFTMQKINDMTLIIQINGLMADRDQEDNLHYSLPGYTINTLNLSTREQKFSRARGSICGLHIITETEFLFFNNINNKTYITLCNQESQRMVSMRVPVYTYTTIPFSKNVYALGVKNGIINLWSAEKNAIIQTLKNPTHDPEATLRHGASLGKKLFASAYHTIHPQIYIWDTDTASLQCSLEGHNKRIQTLTPLTSTLLASGSDDASIKLWDIEKARCIQTSPVDTSGVKTLLALKDTIIAAGYEKSLIKLWDTRSNTYIQTLSGHTKAINSLIKISCNRFASCSDNGTVKIWDTRYEIGQK